MLLPCDQVANSWVLTYSVYTQCAWDWHTAFGLCWILLGFALIAMLGYAMSLEKTIAIKMAVANTREYAQDKATNQGNRRPSVITNMLASTQSTTCVDGESNQSHQPRRARAPSTATALAESLERSHRLNQIAAMVEKDASIVEEVSNEEKDTYMLWAFLLRSYQPRYWWWELSVIVRKTLILAAMEYAPDSVNMEVAVPRPPVIPPFDISFGCRAESFSCSQ